MTDADTASEILVCAWCEESFERPHRFGRRPEACSLGCRRVLKAIRQARPDIIEFANSVLDSPGYRGMMEALAASAKEFSGRFASQMEPAVAAATQTQQTLSEAFAAATASWTATSAQLASALTLAVSEPLHRLQPVFERTAESITRQLEFNTSTLEGTFAQLGAQASAILGQHNAAFAALFANESLRAPGNLSQWFASLELAEVPRLLSGPFDCDGSWRDMLSTVEDLADRLGLNCEVDDLDDPARGSMEPSLHRDQQALLAVPLLLLLALAAGSVALDPSRTGETMREVANSPPVVYTASALLSDLVVRLVWYLFKLGWRRTLAADGALHDPNVQDVA